MRWRLILGIDESCISISLPHNESISSRWSRTCLRFTRPGFGCTTLLPRMLQVNSPINRPSIRLLLKIIRLNLELLICKLNMTISVQDLVILLDNNNISLCNPVLCILLLVDTTPLLRNNITLLAHILPHQLLRICPSSHRASHPRDNGNDPTFTKRKKGVYPTQKFATDPELREDKTFYWQCEKKFPVLLLFPLFHLSRTVIHNILENI
jgi:hypothetical protein